MFTADSTKPPPGWPKVFAVCPHSLPREAESSLVNSDASFRLVQPSCRITLYWMDMCIKVGGWVGRGGVVCLRGWGWGWGNEAKDVCTDREGWVNKALVKDILAASMLFGMFAVPEEENVFESKGQWPRGCSTCWGWRLQPFWVPVVQPTLRQLAKFFDSRKLFLH